MLENLNCIIYKPTERLCSLHTQRLYQKEGRMEDQDYKGLDMLEILSSYSYHLSPTGTASSCLNKMPNSLCLYWAVTVLDHF